MSNEAAILASFLLIVVVVFFNKKQPFSSLNEEWEIDVKISCVLNTLTSFLITSAGLGKVLAFVATCVSYVLGGIISAVVWGIAKVAGENMDLMDLIGTMSSGVTIVIAVLVPVSVVMSMIPKISNSVDWPAAWGCLFIVPLFTDSWETLSGLLEDTTKELEKSAG